MTASFQEFKDRAAEWWPDAFVAEDDDVFALASDGFALRFAALPGDPAATLVRARVLDLADVPRAADFAKAALAGNFFWGGTRGATLSVGAEAFKNWLSDCATGVAKRIATMFSEENLVKSTELYRDALLAADGDFELQYRLQDAWRTLSTLPADAGLDAKVDAMHAFLVNAVLAFRTAAA